MSYKEKVISQHDVPGKKEGRGRHMRIFERVMDLKNGEALEVVCDTIEEARSLKGELLRHQVKGRFLILSCHQRGFQVFLSRKNEEALVKLK